MRRPLSAFCNIFIYTYIYVRDSLENLNIEAELKKCFACKKKHVLATLVDLLTVSLKVLMKMLVEVMIALHLQVCLK